jgi:hypothetical protein
VIPATRPYAAAYRHTGKDGKAHYTHKPVIAWDDEGRALVCDDKTGRLVPVDHYTNFANVEEDGEIRYVAAIPGGGWRLAWKNDDGPELIEPVLAWVIGAEGEARALTVDKECWAEMVDPLSDSGPRVIAPGKPDDDGAATETETTP